MKQLAWTALVACLALSAAARARAEAPGIYREALVTSDGVRATLYHYVPEPGLGPRPAVLLLPDVGMTRRAFDFGKRGLARHLVGYGAEVFVLEYRGAGRSDTPAGGFGFEELLDKDVEAAFARALQGRARIHVGGLGLGGTLALLVALRHPEQVAGLIGLQAAATLEVPNLPTARVLEGLGPLPDWLDLRLASRAPLFEGRTWFELMLANDGSIGPGELRALRLSALSRLPRPLLADLVRFMRERRITVGGRDVRELAAGFRGRSLLFVAPRDNWIHPEFATPLYRLLDPERTEVRVLNPLEGARFEYGHLGMLLGSAAARDVWGPVLRFVKQEAP